MPVRSIILYYLSTILLSFIGTVILALFLTNWLLNGLIEQLGLFLFDTSVVGISIISPLLSYLN